MILKASQRANGQNLAAHLMRMDDNDHVRLHNLRGFGADSLAGAFLEAEAISKGTKCRQYLFSLSLSPPENVRASVEVFEDAIGRVEDRLGLIGQPRAIVFHEKEGRLHCHAVWSRIDADSMTAKHMSFFKTKLNGISRDLYLDHGWTMPRGLESTAERNPTNFSLAEWQQAKRQGIDPRWVKSAVQDCWKRSDNNASFDRALQDRGFFLARGDKRGFVVLDHQGEVWSLPRVLDLKTKEVRERIGEGGDLKAVDDIKAVIGERMTPAIRRHIEESRTQFQRRSALLGEKKEEITRAHRAERADLAGRQALQWEAETRQRASRLPTGLRGLWHRITGQYQEVRRFNEQEARDTQLRHAQESQHLGDRQHTERAALQAEFKFLRHAQAQQLLELREDVGRFLKFTRPERSQARSRDQSIGLRLQR